MHSYARMYVCTCIRTYIHTKSYMIYETYLYFTYMHICISTRISQNLHISILIGIPACIFTYMHLCIFTYVHVNMDIHVLLSCHWMSMLNPWCAPRFSAGNRHWSSGHCVGRRSVWNTDASFATTWSHLRTVPGPGCCWKSFREWYELQLRYQPAKQITKLSCRTWTYHSGME